MNFPTKMSPCGQERAQIQDDDQFLGSYYAALQKGGGGHCSKRTSIASGQKGRDQEALSSHGLVRKPTTTKDRALRRAANRLAARNCHRRQKLLVEQLQLENVLLRTENASTHMTLVACRAERKRLRTMQEQVHRRNVLSTVPLMREVQVQGERLHDPTHHLLSSRSAMAVSALLELAAGRSHNMPQLAPSPSSCTSTTIPRGGDKCYPLTPSAVGGCEYEEVKHHRESITDIPHDLLITESLVLRRYEDVKGVRNFLASQLFGTQQLG